MSAYSDRVREELKGVDITSFDFREADDIRPGITFRWDIAWGRPMPRNRWERWMLNARVYLDRARDAWLVLTGRADID